MQNKNKIKRLAKDQCACYLGDKHGISNYCCWKDGSCAFFDQEYNLPSCRYFENGVLPVDEDLEREYKLKRDMEVGSKQVKPKVNCKRCCETFSANSNRYHYCDKCREKKKKENTRLRVQKFRQKQG